MATGFADMTGTAGFGLGCTGTVSTGCCAPGPITVTMRLTIRNPADDPPCPGGPSGFGGFAPTADGMGAAPRVLGGTTLVARESQPSPGRKLDGTWLVQPLPPAPPFAGPRPGGLAVVTAAVGPIGRAYLAAAGPTQLAYAKRVGADYRVIAGPDAEVYPLRWKWRVWDYLGWYDRVLFLDADVVLGPDCPDLFAAVPPGVVGARDDWSHLKSHDWLVTEGRAVAAAAGLGLADVRTCWNTGVMVLSAAHRPLVGPPAEPLPAFHCTEQHLFNLRARDLAAPVVDLPWGLHWHPYMDRKRERTAGVHVWHLAGEVNRAAKLHRLVRDLYPDGLDPLPACRFRGRKDQAAARAAGLSVQRDWFPCGKPGFARQGSLVTDCAGCGLRADKRCLPGYCDGYEAGDG